MVDGMNKRLPKRSKERCPCGNKPGPGFEGTGYCGRHQPQGIGSTVTAEKKASVSAVSDQLAEQHGPRWVKSVEPLEQWNLCKEELVTSREAVFDAGESFSAEVDRLRADRNDLSWRLRRGELACKELAAETTDVLEYQRLGGKASGLQLAEDKLRGYMTSSWNDPVETWETQKDKWEDDDLDMMVDAVDRLAEETALMRANHESFEERLEDSVVKIDELARYSEDANEKARLGGKKEGVRTAQEYLRSYNPTF